jgi:hypothetical protein
MKRITTIAIIIAISIASIAQEKPEDMLKTLEGNDTLKQVEIDTLGYATNDSNQIEMGNEIMKVDTDTTKIRFGKRNIVIIEKDGATAIEIPERKYFEDEEEGPRKKKAKKFKGHWAGFEWGFNGYMDPNYSINMKDELRYLELKQGRSWNFNLNFSQYSFGFKTDKVGLVTGLGFEFNNYHFRNQTTLTRGTAVTGVDSTYIFDSDKNVIKSKLSTTHLTLPLLFEFQIPTSNDKHRIFFSTGVIGSVRIGSSTKVEFEGTSKGEDKVKNDFNLSPFRYGITARIGYRGLKLFANYYPTPLFEKDKGPELYPFSVGLILLSFN